MFQLYTAHISALPETVIKFGPAYMKQLALVNVQFAGVHNLSRRHETETYLFATLTQRQVGDSS